MKVLIGAIGLVPGSVLAQTAADSANPKTPSACLAYVVQPALQQAWKKASEIRAKTYLVVKDKVAEEQERVQLNAIADSARAKAAERCLKRFTVAKTGKKELISLMELFVHARRYSDADAAFRKRYYTLAKGVQEKADVLAQSIDVYRAEGHDATVQATRYQLLVLMDELGDTVLPQRVKGHYTLGLSWHEDSVARRFTHARRTVELGARLRDPKDRMLLAAEISYMYVELARHYQRMGDFEHAASIADSGIKALSGVTLDEYNTLPGYGLLGKSAPPVESSHWFNAPRGFTRYEGGKGKITVIEFTSYG